MKSYRMIALAFVAALALTAVNAGAQTMSAPRGTLAGADQTFINDAVQSDLAEVQMGKLAQQKGQSQGVKDFGQMLEQDHSQHLQNANKRRNSWA
jgi:putative membrane protein